MNEKDDQDAWTDAMRVHMAAWIGLEPEGWMLEAAAHASHDQARSFAAVRGSGAFGDEPSDFVAALTELAVRP